MAGEVHLLLQARGGYKTAANLPESWQFGIRLAVDVAGIDDVGNLPTGWTSVGVERDRAESTFDVTGNYRLTKVGQDFDPVDFLAEQAHTAIRSIIVAPNCISSEVELRQLTLYPIGDNGRALTNNYGASVATLTYKAGSRPAGAMSGGMLPTEVAVAVSWNTPVRGKKGRGRIYLPPCGVSAVAPTGLLQSTNQTAIKATVAEALRTLTVTGPVSVDTTPIVTGVPWNKYGVIDQVRVGNVFDVQRRRRRQLEESYATELV